MLKRATCFSCVLFVCMCSLFSWSLVWAQDGGSTDSRGTPLPPGSIGVACRADGTCVAGAKCFNQSETETLCLLPGTVSGPSQNCPTSQRFLQCETGHQNCHLVCVATRGFGCQISTQLQTSFWFLLPICLLLLCRRTSQRQTL